MCGLFRQNPGAGYDMIEAERTALRRGAVCGLRNVIYLDTLIFLNTVVTFLLLLSVRQFSGVKTADGRLIAASFLGGALSLVILAPPLGFLPELLIRAAGGLLIVTAAFYTRRKERFLKCLWLFLALTFLFAGVTFFLSQLTGGVISRNGASYIGLDFPSLVLLSVVLYVALRLLKKKCFSGRAQYRYEIELRRDGRRVTGKALYDSGHFVADCYTGNPVIIARREFILPLLTAEESGFLAALGRFAVDEPVGTLPARVIPVATVAGERFLPAFTCERAVVQNGDRYVTVDAVSVAVLDAPMELSGCDALINSRIFE